MPKSKKKNMVGVVLSRKMDKTAVVQVVRRVKHPLYHKFYLSRTKYKAHDAKNECIPGDRVLMEEFPPISREKRWVVKGILKKGVEG